MVFKRYIHKHGKKLGPYYYENIRSRDGGVKSIYVGTNPQHHPKHRIRKPLFFFILVLLLILILGGSLFFIQNKAYLIKKARAEEPNFDVDQILLKVLVRSSEFLEKQIRIMNVGSEQITINIEVLGLSDIVKIDSPTFQIKPGQTKVVALNFSSFMPEQKIEQQPGIYVGKLTVKSEKMSKEIPIVVEIETKNVLFDMNLNPVAIERKVKQGSDTTIEVRLFNLQSIESVNVDVEYFVKDMNGNTIVTESETVVAKTQASFFKTISVPDNLKPGPYVFAAQAKFGNSIGTSSYLFEVIGPETEASFVQFCKNNILCLGLSLTTILLLFALMAYLYFFIGAYLYEKITGVVTLPRKKEDEKEELAEEPEEGAEESIFGKIKNKISEWKEEREKKKLETAELEREEESQSIADKRVAELEEKKRQLDEERARFKEQRKQEQLMRQKELEAKRREGQKARKKAEREKLWEEREEKAKGFLHKIGLFRTTEEKRQTALQREKEKQERLRREAGLKQQREQQKLSEEERKEELRKQKDIKAKSREEEKKKIEEEKERKKEQERKQRELEVQRQEQINAQRLGRISHITARLNKNKEISERLNSQLKKLDSEKEILSNNLKQVDSKVESIEQKILEKSKQNEEVSLQKNSLAENYKKQIEDLNKKLEIDKSARQEKIKDMKAALATKQAGLMRELEEELSKLSPAKRKSVERWKRLEAKAKLKIEEQNVEEGLKRHVSKAAGEGQDIEYNYKKSLQDINGKQKVLKQEIADLQAQQQQILAEKRNAPRDLQNKDNEISRIRLKLEIIENEQKQITSELSKLKLGLGLKWKFSGIISAYKEKIQKLRKKREDKKSRPEAEKSEKKEEKPIPEMTTFERLFEKSAEEESKGKESQKIEKKEEPIIEEKPKEKLKPKSDVEELEEAIRGLDLFKKVEKGKTAVKEKPEIKQSEIKVTAKSKELNKFYKVLNDVGGAINKNNISKAKKLYAEARNIYVELGNEDKKEVYNKLMELYNKLK